MTDGPAPSLRRGDQPNHSSYDLNDTATRLVLTYGPLILRDARRYSSCTADAEDAYQRALEILLTKAPSDEDDQLVPWLRTVARREAITIARARGRMLNVPLDPLSEALPADEALPEEALENSAASDLGAEALERLNPDQAHCLLAYAQGHSYSEIAALTGFTARKVARCMTDGRRAFVTRVIDIESGSECERIEPLLQRMADGDSYAHVEARPHLRNCPGCQATLRAYREAPTRVAAFFPAALLAPSIGASAPPAADVAAGLWHQCVAFWAGANERLLGYVNAFQQWAEIGVTKKFGIVALTATALAAGGVAVHDGVTGGSERAAARTATVAAGVRSTGRLFDRIAPPPGPRANDRPKRRRRIAKKSLSPATSRPQASTSASAAQSLGNGSSEFLPESR
jgi:RNA polymerase sigma factor (sigma-70 family)